MIEIIAKAKSWWQNFKNFRSLFRDDDITLYLDNIEIFTSNSKYSDAKTIWNGNELNLLFKTTAVDYNSDIKWAPDNFKKYGYSDCGEIFSNDKLTSAYKDINADGNSDLILIGTKKIMCEIRDKYLKNPYEITVHSAHINKKYLWNKNKYTWINTANRNPDFATGTHKTLF